MQFEDVHRLSDGQVKHSPEVFYAGSLWKVLKYLLIVLYIYKLEIYDEALSIHNGLMQNEFPSLNF